MNLQAAYGLFAQGVIVAALVRLVRVLTGHAKAKPHGVELWLPVMVLLAGSADGVPLAAHLRGIWGDPSVVSLLVMLLFTLQPSWLPSAPRPGVSLSIVAMVAVPLYANCFVPLPTWPGDLYQIGLAPGMILTAIAVGALVFGCAGRFDPRWAVIVSCALAAYAGRLMESDNLWDYLVDPGLMLAMAFLGFTGIWTSLQRRLKAI
jgi:hypothetical protein